MGSDRETLADRQARLSPAKQAFLARWKRGTVAPPASAGRIPRRADPGSARLSFAQERLWFLDQLAPGNPAYNLVALVRLRGPLEVAAMRRAFAEIVRRHEILRTAFRTRDPQPIQTILPRLEMPLPLVDLVRCPHRAEAEGRIRDAARRPFDLGRPPLLRPLIVRLGREEHLLLVSFHHIIFDGWSVGILVREVGGLYEAFRAGRAAALPPLPVQYGDFAEWQREWLHGKVLEKQLTYWTRQLSGPPPVLEMPTDRSRPAVARLRGARVPVDLGPEPAAALTELSRGRETTIIMTLLGAYALLLGRFAGQLDLCIGSPVANRNQTETEALIGFFVNSLALRLDLRGDPSFTTLLAQIRRVTLEAYAHQDLPFALLVEKLSPQRNLSHSPLFQVMFALRNAPSETLRTAELALEPLELDDGTAKFDLLLILTERDQGLSGFLEYDRDLFEPTTISRLAGHFRALARALAADPTRRILALPLLTAAERQQLRAEWNDTVVACPHQATIQELFEDEVRQRPEAVAVVFGRSQLTYGELNRRANQLAHSLRRQGVGPEVCVGLSVERSLEMVVAILGILKAGGAYVPLDPGYPARRLELMVEDVQASVLVTEKRLLRRLPAGFGGALRHCYLDREPAAMAEDGTENPRSGARPENLANVMFTSGSTGRPKGVAVVHRAVVRLVRGADYAALAAGEVFLQFAPIPFDASTLELWGPLLNGGRLVIFPPQLPSPWELGEFVARHAVSTLWLTTGLFHQMVDENLAALRGVRQLLTGGDVMSPLHMRRALAGLPRCRLIHCYGPTENTTFSSCCSVRTAAEAADSVAIGRPISGSRAHVLDRQLRPVGVGVFGELYVAGHGLARGYLKRPGRTAESFVPCPMDCEPGTRLYRTGDLACHLPDGKLEFLGRRDHQIKMRGFRLELGEIEVALLRHPGVREALVEAREEAAGTDKYLVAYVVSHLAPPPTFGELREFLAATLAEYMVPSAIVFLDGLPLLPSGKIDRRALPAPDARRPELGEAFAAPRTPIEELLATIWCDVLDLDRVGIDDSFFDLGGHSLLATQLLSRIRQTFQVELPLRQLFENPTVATLAPAVAAAGSGEPAPPLVPVPRDEDFRHGVPLSFAQQRLWVLDQLAPDDPAYNVPVAVRLRGEADVAALEASLGAITRRHEALRTRFAAIDGKAVQVIAPDLALPLPEVDLQALAPAARERAAERLAGAEARRPFALSRLPLLRAALLRLAPDEVILVLNAHHVVTDGWSMGVLIRGTSGPCCKGPSPPPSGGFASSRWCPPPSVTRCGASGTTPRSTIAKTAACTS